MAEIRCVCKNEIKNMNFKTWFHGLVAAIVGGVATTVTVMVVDPVAFNFGDLGKLGKVALISGIVNAAFYLRKSPLPDYLGTEILDTK